MSGRPKTGSTLRHIVKNGNCTQVSIPPQILDALRWRVGDVVRVEMLDVDAFIVRAARLADLRAPGLPAPVTSPLEKVSA